jgi:hypothetical protein
MPSVSFDVEISAIGLSPDGCGYHFGLEGAAVTLIAYVDHYRGSYPYTDVAYQWDAPTGAVAQGPLNRQSLQLVLGAIGVAGTTVHVTLKTFDVEKPTYRPPQIVTIQASQDRPFQVAVVSPQEAGLREALCRLRNEMRSIPQRIPGGDPARTVVVADPYSPEELAELKQGGERIVDATRGLQENLTALAKELGLRLK